jgi:hypothetical protein
VPVIIGGDHGTAMDTLLDELRDFLTILVTAEHVAQEPRKEFQIQDPFTSSTRSVP